jgi:uncharacterized protein
MKNIVFFRFYEELNDYLSVEKRKHQFEYLFEGSRSIRQALNDLKVPPAEVDLILANGESVTFSYRLKPEDKISVFPVFESLDISAITRVRKKPLRKIKFILDNGLENLRDKLSEFGYDAVGRPSGGESEFIRTALKEERILLTSDEKILEDSAVTHGYFVRSSSTAEQLSEIMRRFDLSGK